MSRFIFPKIEPGRSPLDSYVHDINKTPLLNSEEERELGLRSGLAIAKRDQMVRANMRSSSVSLAVIPERGWTC